IPRNYGFAAGNNSALREILAASAPDPSACILLLNPDTLVKPGAIQSLLSFMESHPNAGIAGSQLIDAEGKPQCAAHRLPSALAELEDALSLRLAAKMLAPWSYTLPPAAEPFRCDWVSGAALLMRRDCLRQIGLLDERFFLYYEEVDWCR